MKIKYLQLERWMQYVDNDTHKISVAGDKIFKNNKIPKKDGWYLFANCLCYFVFDGVVYFGDVNDFKQELNLKNHIPLRQCVVDSMKQLNREKILSEDMLKLYNLDCFWHSIRNTYRSVQLFVIKSEKRNANK